VGVIGQLPLGAVLTGDAVLSRRFLPWTPCNRHRYRVRLIAARLVAVSEHLGVSREQ